MSDKAEYYQLKGMISEMPVDHQLEVEQAMEEVIAIAKRSDNAMLGATMAMIKIAIEA